MIIIANPPCGGQSTVSIPVLIMSEKVKYRCDVNGVDDKASCVQSGAELRLIDASMQCVQIGKICLKARVTTSHLL